VSPNLIILIPPSAYVSNIPTVHFTCFFIKRLETEQISYRY